MAQRASEAMSITTVMQILHAQSGARLWGSLGISARLFTCLLRYLSSIMCFSFLRQCSLKQPHCVNFCSRKPRHATIQEITREKKRKKFTWSTWTRKFTWSDIQQNKVILPPAAPCKLFLPPFWDDAETKVYIAQTEEINGPNRKFT